MTHKLLTIAIPTFNRSQHLALLLDVLAGELRDTQQHVELLIFDNASTDATPAVTAGFQARFPECRIVRHAQNIGSAPNFRACFAAATSRYFWMLGDDDAPVTGLLAKLVDLLLREAPDMTYLESLWVDDIAPLIGQRRATEAPARLIGRTGFARRTNVYLTFISSIIVNRSRLLERVDVAGQFDHLGAYFCQLSWTLGALRYGERFAVVDEPCVLATKANSSGYGAVTAFGSEFPSAVRKLLGTSGEAVIILRRTIACYLPGLIWGIRNGTVGAFDAENPWPRVQRELGSHPLYWLLLVPIGRFPKLAAMPFYQAWRVFNRLVREADRLLAKPRLGKRAAT